LKTASAQRGQILILLAAWLFFGGGASSALVVYDRPASEMEKAVKRAVMDGDVRARRDEILEALRHKDARRSEMEPVIAGLDQTFLEMDQSFLNLRFRVKEQVTRAEWADIVARPDR